MYNRLNHSQCYQICTGGSSAILRGSPQFPLPENFVIVSRLGRDRFRPNFWQHTFHERVYHSTLYRLSCWNCRQ